MAERADDRLVRLLGLVAYLDRANGVPVTELAHRFNVSEHQILADIDALWMSGTPGYWPDDLIDFDADSYHQGIVRLTEARGMTRPLRLAPREATALITALRALADSLAVSTDNDRAAAVTSVLKKLSDATGEAAAAVDVQLAPEGSSEIVSTVSTAITDHRRLRIHYVTVADVTSHREIDPVSVHVADEHAYVVAWCHRAGDRRTFRLDRILHAELLDTPTAHHTMAETADFIPAENAPLATIRFASPARPVAELVPVEAVRNHPDGSFEIDIRVTNPAWLRQVLLAQAEHVQQIAPQQFAREIADAAAATLDAYQRTNNP